MEICMKEQLELGGGGGGERQVHRQKYRLDKKVVK